jgi:hypothetical protein
MADPAAWAPLTEPVQTRRNGQNSSRCISFPSVSKTLGRNNWHYTPKHGSWLNIAECELSVLARQCLDRRIPDQASLETQVAAWTQNRNNAQAKTTWHFTTEDARTKLIKLYPQID